MLGCYDFCGHYDWTFHWLAEQGGEELLHRYWNDAICGESQQHAVRLIVEKGLDGMEQYWGRTLEEEAPSGGYQTHVVGDRFILEMTDCPSRGFLLRNRICFSRDYCDHCIGWIGPMMKQAGYTVTHAHNHHGQCYWEFIPAGDIETENPCVEELKHSREQAWISAGMTIDYFDRAQDAAAKRIEQAAGSGREDGSGGSVFTSKTGVK